MNHLDTNTASPREGTTQVATVTASASSSSPKIDKQPTPRYEKYEEMKREKRLAMNRECARVRRRRKKLRMELLENKVDNLKETNAVMAKENETLMVRVAQLECELELTRSKLVGASSSSSSSSPGTNLAALRSSGVVRPSASSFVAGKSDGSNRSAFLPEPTPADFLEARRATLAEAVGGGGAGEGGGGGTPAGLSPPSALEYMQLLRASRGLHGDSMDAVGRVTRNMLRDGSGAAYSPSNGTNGSQRLADLLGYRSLLQNGW